MSFFNAFTLPQYRASANIRPARILAVSNTTKELVAEATGNTLPFIGVGANRYKYQFGGFEQQAFPYLAQTGDEVDYRGPGMEAHVIAGAAISALGKPLGSDANGQALSVTPGQTTGGTYIFGFPRDTAAALGEVIRCFVVPSTPILI